MPTIAEAVLSEDVITPEKISSARQSLPGKTTEMKQTLALSPENEDEIRTEAPRPIAPSSFVRNSVTSLKAETEDRGPIKVSPVKKKQEINRSSTFKTL